jgi:O-antigen/teichoic acid export membrane protein
MKPDSVAKGGLSVATARAVGMIFSFLLFLSLARQSESGAAIFRTLVVFLYIAEFLGLLGTQRWLIIELVKPGHQRKVLFINALTYALIISCCIGSIYLIISYSGMYGDAISLGLRYIAFGAIGSAFLMCIQSTLVGVGLSSKVGLLNLVENVTRALIGLALVYLKQNVLSIIIVFVLMRWAIVVAGLIVVLHKLEGPRVSPRMSMLKLFFKQTPQFAMIMVAFLTMRNAGFILLPAISSNRETARFAVPYQLYDLLLLLPTMLALSSSYIFAASAARSQASLRLAIMRLLSITSMYILPLVAISLALGKHILVLLVGMRYANAAPTFSILMVAAPLMTIDQVLSQAMISSKQYRNDRIAVSVGATCAVILTFMLGRAYGATGAAAAFLVSVFVTVSGRFLLSKGLLKFREVVLVTWKPAISGVFAYVTATGLASFTHIMGWDILNLVWPIIAAIGLAAYAVSLFALGGLSTRQRRRMKRLLFQREL